MVKRQAYQPILITDASRSQGDQLNSRQRRYVLMMGIRVACIIVGAILVGANAPLLWLWLPLCALGMVLIPGWPCCWPTTGRQRKSTGWPTGSTAGTRTTPRR